MRRLVALSVLVLLLLAAVGCGGRGGFLDGEPVWVTEKKSGARVAVVVKRQKDDVVVARGTMVGKEPLGEWKRFAAKGSEIASGSYAGWTVAQLRTFIPDDLLCTGEDGKNVPAVVVSKQCDEWNTGFNGRGSTSTCVRSHEVKTPGCTPFPAELFLTPDEMASAKGPSEMKRIYDGLAAP